MKLKPSIVRNSTHNDRQIGPTAQQLAPKLSAIRIQMLLLRQILPVVLISHLLGGTSLCGFLARPFALHLSLIHISEPTRPY